jgi:hypothetical protein
MLHKDSSEIQLILHDHPEPPRLLVIKKNTLKRFLVVIPLLFALAFLAVAVLALGWKTPQLSVPKVNIRTTETPRTTTDEPPDSEVAAELKAIKSAQVAMQEKLALTHPSEVEVWLGPVKRPYALQDLTAKNLLKLENIALEDGGGKRVMRFNLINAGEPTERVTGHIFVFQIDNRGLSPYPAMTPQELLEGIRYNKGESFAVARLRPVEAPFPPSDTDARFLVLVFNREGDLLVRQTFNASTIGKGQ